MVEIKFNFYSTFNKYYRNINKSVIINNTYMYHTPLYDDVYNVYLDFENFNKFDDNKLELYIFAELHTKLKIDYFVYQSFKKIIVKNINTKCMFNFKKFNFKITNLLKF